MEEDSITIDVQQSALTADDSKVISPSVLNSTTTLDLNIMGSSATDGGKHTNITLRDLKKIIEKDDHFSEVTVEQIERVKLMHDKFMDGAVFNFNYNTLLLVASVIAGLGLVSNSTATIIASMLVSPIMGPVVAIAYGKYCLEDDTTSKDLHFGAYYGPFSSTGTTIFDRKMVRLAWANELVSILVCILVGIIIGACTGWVCCGILWLPFSNTILIQHTNLSSIRLSLLRVGQLTKCCPGATYKTFTLVFQLVRKKMFVTLNPLPFSFT